MENPNTQQMAIVNFVIRPPRAEYSIEDLGNEILNTIIIGDKEFLVGGKACIREDIDLENKDGHKMVCSFFRFKNDTVWIAH